MSNMNIIIHTMKRKSKYPIQYVSNVTGLKPYILRSWESRYAAICPERTETNRRLYTVGDIRRLRLINDAILSGHSISQVAPMSDDELLRLSKYGKRSNVSPPERDIDNSAENETKIVISSALYKIRQLDQVGLEKVLDRAAVNLPRSKYLHHVVQPLFGKIGEMWAAGDMKIIHERLATLVIRSQLLDMLKSTILSDSAPRLVVAAPVGQWHETGCLVAALTAAESGWRPMYFGPNLPAEEIAAAAQSTNSKIIALSVGQRINPSITLREVRKLKKYCAKQAKIIVGGYGALNLKARLEPIGVKCITDVKVFSKELETS